MDDLISRQAAIDEVVAWLRDRMTDGKNGKPLTERLKALPPAQPEQKIGHWIELKTFLGRGVICSECGKLALHQVWSDGRGEIECEYANSNFCPSCGAKMEVKNDGRPD